MHEAKSALSASVNNLPCSVVFCDILCWCACACCDHCNRDCELVRSCSVKGIRVQSDSVDQHLASICIHRVAAARAEMQLKQSLVSELLNTPTFVGGCHFRPAKLLQRRWPRTCVKAEQACQCTPVHCNIVQPVCVLQAGSEHLLTLFNTAGEKRPVQLRHKQQVI
jgi:hypothetical protein